MVNALVGDHFGYSDLPGSEFFKIFVWIFLVFWWKNVLCDERQPKARLFGMVL